MPALTIKNMPDELYNELKSVASKHHRSINSEVIVRLKQSVFPDKISPNQFLANIQHLRSTIKDNVLTAEDIDKAIEDGRA
ncbi:MAG: Arc family DNA-binding protein [Gammaproteobacteria bacterium]|nr:Arc family DNA-binding protein [Gammaproteobacteria bacterium]